MDISVYISFPQNFLFLDFSFIFRRFPLRSKNSFTSLSTLSTNSTFLCPLCPSLSLTEKSGSLFFELMLYLYSLKTDRLSLSNWKKQVNTLSELSLHTDIDNRTTILPNIFIDRYMPQANGEYVKLYLYLLRVVSAGKMISLGEIAETLEHTEKDIHRALSYWQREGLLQLTFDENDTLSGIRFLDPEASVSSKPDTAEAAAALESDPFRKVPLSADRTAELSSQDDIQQLIYIASKYIGKPLSPTEISNILYFYDTLHFSADLIEYLIEYCVSKGSKSSHYMEKVALEWAKEGIRTVAEAKQSTNLYNRNYYKILNAFGIKGRGPVKPEVECMERWLNTWHFTIDLITEACGRTISQTQRPNFQYADKILEEWHKAKVRHLSDLKELDAEHAKKKKSTEPKPKAASTNRFNNFHQRDYDFDELEKQLLNT